MKVKEGCNFYKIKFSDMGADESEFVIEMLSNEGYFLFRDMVGNYELRKIEGNVKIGFGDYEDEIIQLCRKFHIQKYMVESFRFRNYFSNPHLQMVVDTLLQGYRVDSNSNKCLALGIKNKNLFFMAEVDKEQIM